MRTGSNKTSKRGLRPIAYPLNAAVVADAGVIDRSYSSNKDAQAPLSLDQAARNSRHSRLRARATASCVSLPSWTLRPCARPRSLASAWCQPWSARDLTYGSVALVKANVEVRGTAPGILVTQ